MKKASRIWIVLPLLLILFVPIASEAQIKSDSASPEAVTNYQTSVYISWLIGPSGSLSIEREFFQKKYFQKISAHVFDCFRRFPR